MKTLFTSLFLLIGLSYGLAQQIDLTGQISIHNSRYRTGQIEYVADAFVSAPFAGSTNSDSEGLFGLTFQGIESGTVIKLAAEKAGLEVVNTYDLERVVLGQKPKLPVYLAPKGRLAEAQTELYNISKTALFARRDAIIARLRGEKAESDAALAELERDWGIEIGSVGEAVELLEDKIAELQKRLPEFAQELATKNLDFASELYIQAYELYQAGDIVGAIAILDDAILEQSYQEALSTLTEGKRLESAAQDLQAKGQLQIEQVVESYRLKAEGHNFLFEYRAAAAAQRKVVDILEAGTKEETIELADAYWALGNTLRELGKYSEALSFQLDGTQIKERLLSADDSDLATSYSNLASTYRDLGQYKQALATQQKALAIRVQVLESNHPHVANSYNNLALIYRDLGNYEQALVAQQKALAIREQILGFNHSGTAQSYNNLAIIYRDLGKYKQALVTQQKDIAIIEQILEPNHPSRAISYNNLASIYQSLGQYDEALAMQQKALAIREQILEPNHPRLATSYNNLASIHQSLGQYDEALAMQQKALAIREQILEPNHPHVANSYNNLALIYRDLGHYEQALVAQQKALAIQEQVLEPGHPDVVRSYNNLASIYQYSRQYEQALAVQQKALAIQEQILEPNQPDVAQSYNNLASIYKDLGQYEQALAAQQKAIAIIEQVLEPNHPSIATSYHNLVSIFYYLGQPDSALIYEERAYAIWQEKLQNNHPYLQLAKENFAFLYPERAAQRRSAGQFIEAIEDYQRALEFSEDRGELYKAIGLTHTLNGEIDAALDNLEKAIQLGYDNWEWLRNDEALEPLRDHPRFKALLARAPDQKE